MFDCVYCVNRSSSNVQRTRFTVEEVVALTLSFYKRNYIEGLFLSSGIIRSPDYTMEQIARVAQTLREVHGFAGYIHLKTIPEADPSLIELAGRYADRLSINVELPTAESLTALAPQKQMPTIRRSMARLRATIDDRHGERRQNAKAPKFAPAGQSTQVIVGADTSTDVDILNMSSNLYSGYRLKRVYYSGFSPIPDSSAALPLRAPPLIREHRLYQADWLYRFYGFSVTEIASATSGGMLDPAIDPKLAWALIHRGDFPVDINKAAKERLLRIPGLGVKAVARILETRRFHTLRLEDLRRLTASIKKMLPFVITADWRPTRSLDSGTLDEQLRRPATQLDLFAS